MLNGTRFEQAICRMIGTMPDRFDLHDRALAEFPNKVTTHLMAHFAMLRNLVIEDQFAAKTNNARYNKTGGFRRACGAANWILYSPILKSIASTMDSDSATSVKSERGDCDLINPKAELESTKSEHDDDSILQSAVGSEVDSNGSLSAPKN